MPTTPIKGGSCGCKPHYLNTLSDDACRCGQLPLAVLFSSICAINSQEPVFTVTVGGNGHLTLLWINPENVLEQSYLMSYRLTYNILFTDDATPGWEFVDTLLGDRRNHHTQPFANFFKAAQDEGYEPYWRQGVMGDDTLEVFFYQPNDGTVIHLDFNVTNLSTLRAEKDRQAKQTLIEQYDEQARLAALRDHHAYSALLAAMAELISDGHTKASTIQIDSDLAMTYAVDGGETRSLLYATAHKGPMPFTPAEETNASCSKALLMLEEHGYNNPYIQALQQFFHAMKCTGYKLRGVTQRCDRLYYSRDTYVENLSTWYQVDLFLSGLEKVV